MSADAVYWMCAGSSLLATWWNIQHKRICFWIWLGTNVVWAYASFTHDLAPKGWLHVAYGVLAVVGLLRWRAPQTAVCSTCRTAPSARTG